MLTVYRLEVLGKGVYRRREVEEQLPESLLEILKEMSRAHSWVPSHPNYIEDELYDCFTPEKMESLLFGCDSLISLNKWFSGYLDRFADYTEIEICEYKTEEIYYGKSKKQIVFVPIDGSRRVL